MNSSWLCILEHENLWGYRKRLRFILANIARHFPGRAPSSLTVLDVGCGNGSMIALPLAHQGYRVTGLDVDAASVEKARELALGLPAVFLCGELASFAPRFRGDVVICSEVLEHLDDPVALLAGCVARLAAGGLLIVTAPNGYGPFEVESYLYRRLRMERVVEPARRWLRSRRGEGTLGATENISCGHRQFFTGRQLRQMFDACGLRLVNRSGGSLFCGPFSEAALRWFPRLFSWNAGVTDYLPAFLHSSWYFALVRRSDPA